MPKLTVENVEIKTATVEIRVISVSGRGITQAMFKQFPERSLVADDGTLNGVPWGWVNYCPTKCADDPHLHVVWQLDKEIFRSRVGLDVVYPRRIECRTAGAWLDAKVREDATSVLTGWEPTPDEVTKSFRGISVHMVMGAEAQKVTRARGRVEEARRAVAEHGPSSLMKVARPRPQRSAVPTSGIAAARAASWAANPWMQVPAGDVLRGAEDELEKALAALPTTPLVEAEARLMAEVREEAERRRRHCEVRRTLTELPQLYIAK